MTHGSVWEGVEWGFSDAHDDDDNDDEDDDIGYDDGACVCQFVLALQFMHRKHCLTQNQAFGAEVLLVQSSGRFLSLTQCIL